MIREPKHSIPRTFYAHPNVAYIAQKLLGTMICSTVGGHFTSGIITETEAYCGRNDKACHANNGLRTARTEIMYGPPGYSYIYLCYGIHHLFNVVTNKKELADAVLIRSIKPISGIETMKKRRNKITLTNLTNGPGKLTQALNITTDFNAIDLSQPPIWLEYSSVQTGPIQTSPRIGVNYAKEDANRLWRFYIEEKDFNL